MTKKTKILIIILVIILLIGGILCCQYLRTLKEKVGSPEKKSKPITKESFIEDVIEHCSVKGFDTEDSKNYSSESDLSRSDFMKVFMTTVCLSKKMAEAGDCNILDYDSYIKISEDLIPKILEKEVIEYEDFLKIKGGWLDQLCYFFIGVKDKNPKACSITFVSSSDQGFLAAGCDDVIQKDLQKCESLFRQDKREYCRTIIENDPKQCNGNAWCLIPLMMHNFDSVSPSTCDFISEEFMTIDTDPEAGVSWCYILVEALSDESICEKIDPETSESVCFRYTKIKKDISICNKIQNQDSKDRCYRGVAIFEKDLSICNKIQNQTIKDSCYREVAKAE